MEDIDAAFTRGITREGGKSEDPAKPGETGVTLSGLLNAIDGVAATLRTNLAIAGEVRALSSQARLSALVIVLAPLALSFLATTADGGTAAFLLGKPLGLLCLVAGLGLDGVGWLWMRRIVASVA